MPPEINRLTEACKKIQAVVAFKASLHQISAKNKSYEIVHAHILYNSRYV